MVTVCAKQADSSVQEMSSAQRLMAAYRGEAVDRVPVWLRQGFPPFGQLADAESFECGWQAEDLYRKLYNDLASRVDWIATWYVFGQNRWLMVPDKAIESEVIEETHQRRRIKRTVCTPRGNLYSVREFRRGQNTGWTIKPLAESREDLAKLAEVPFEIDEEAIARSIKSYRDVESRSGEEALLRTSMSSAMVCISGCMSLELFLELSITDQEWMAELCEEILRRQLAICERVFRSGMRTIVNIGGSEQCTPPLMSPESYDRLVVPYETRLIEFLHEMGIPVQIHCHGKVRHALDCMLQEGADATDPVEPPPAGDVTYEEAREIVGDRITLIGNLEWSMLESAEPKQIREHVKRVLSYGNRRLILAASAGPISAITPRLADNYRAWIDAAEEFGG